MKANSGPDGQTQKTRPKKGKPVEIPVPTHKEVEDLMRGVTGVRPSGRGRSRPPI
jgi:GTPase involved in cell partitioning and DNA repair